MEFFSQIFRPVLSGVPVRIIVFSILLLLAVSVQAQINGDTLQTMPEDTTVPAEPEMFDMEGIPLGDTMEVFSADTIIRADSAALARGDTFRFVKHPVLRALWMSAVLPGLGQAYNKKYWKIGVVYAGFAGLSVGLYYMSTDFNQARSAYRLLVRDQGATYLGLYYPPGSDPSTIKAYSYLNILAMVTALWYALNLIDATVDAHLYNYNMDDRLSFNFDPSFHIQNEFGLSQSCLGLSLTIIPLAGKRNKTVTLSTP
jgi:hypothetical protein